MNCEVINMLDIHRLKRTFISFQFRSFINQRVMKKLLHSRKKETFMCMQCIHQSFSWF